MDANNKAAIAAAIATGIAVAIVAVEPAHAALASHLMPPTVYAPQFADLAVNVPAAVTTTQAGIDGTLDTTLISTSVFLLLATVLGSAGKKYSEKRARRAVWRGLASPHDSTPESPESVEHRRSNIVTKAGKKTGVNTKSIDATKIDAPGAQSLKSSRYNITPLKKGSVDSDRKAQKIQKAQKISSGASNIINYKQKPTGAKTAKRTVTSSSTKGTVFLTKSNPGDYGYKNSVTKKPYEDSVLAAAAAFFVGAVALTNVTATSAAPGRHQGATHDGNPARGDRRSFQNWLRANLRSGNRRRHLRSNPTRAVPRHPRRRRHPHPPRAHLRGGRQTRQGVLRAQDVRIWGFPNRRSRRHRRQSR
jgi:hypothetical protein